MRANSPPTASPVAAAALVLVAAVLAPLAVPSAALAERWLRPVPGELARPFSYASDAPFVKGAHRGADLAAPPGTAVRAACSGRVIHAGAVAGRDEVVSVRCGDRRVSHLPLATVAVRSGATIRAGAPIGTLAPGHGGLHVGVRREDDPFGYEDPMALLPPSEAPFAPAPSKARPRAARRPAARPAPRRLAPRPAARQARRRIAPRPLDPRLALRPSSSAPRLAAWPSTSARLAGRPPSSLAPWPVWLGFGVLLSGAAGSGTIAVRRRRIARRARVVAAAR